MHRLVRITAATALLSFAGAAQANCDSFVKSVGTASPEQIGPTFASLAECDANMANEHFDDFLRAAKDVDTLTALCLAAIDNQIHTPVSAMLEKMSGGPKSSHLL